MHRRAPTVAMRLSEAEGIKVLSPQKVWRRTWRGVVFADRPILAHQVQPPQASDELEETSLATCQVLHCTQIGSQIHHVQVLALYFGLAIVDRAGHDVEPGEEYFYPYQYKSYPQAGQSPEKVKY